MTSLPEQFSAARKAQFEAQFDFFNSFASQALESASRVVALNLATSRDSVQRSLGATFALLNSQDPRDLLTVGGQAEEQVRTLFDYSRELFSIASGIRPYGVNPETLARAPQQAIETVQVVERAAADAVSDAVAEAQQVVEPVVAAQAPVAEQAAIASEPVGVAEPAVAEAPVMADTVVTAEPIIVAELEQAANVVSDATAQEFAAEAVEPSPVAEPNAIAKAAGKGSPRAAVAQHPASAPVLDADNAERPKISVSNGSSKRRK